MFELISSQATDAGFEGVAGAYCADLPDALYFASGETNLWITPMAGTISVELDARWCKINETMPAGDLLSWLNSKPLDLIAAELGRAGIDTKTMSECTISRRDGNYSVENKIAKYSRLTLDGAVYSVKIYFKVRSQLNEHIVTTLIKNDLAGFKRVDGWYVCAADKRYRVKLTEQFGNTEDADCIILEIDFAGTICSRTFSRGASIDDCDIIKILRQILTLTHERDKLGNWARKHICDISNYAQVSAALAAIGYGLMRTEHDSPTVEKYASGLSEGAAVVMIEITSVYELCVCCGDGKYDRITTFPFGTDPAEIIEWILDQQPIYADLLRMRDKLTATESELKAAKTELAAMKITQAQIREVVQ